MNGMSKRRMKLRAMHVLIETNAGAHTPQWYEGVVPSNDPHREERAFATEHLTENGLLEKDKDYPAPRHPHPYRLTTKGEAFLDNVIRRIGKDNSLAWNRVKEIEFPS